MPLWKSILFRPYERWLYSWTQQLRHETGERHPCPLPSFRPSRTELLIEILIKLHNAEKKITQWYNANYDS